MLLRCKVTKLFYINVPFTKLRVSVAFVIILASMLVCDFSVYSFCVIISAALHEAGHIVALKMAGAKIQNITVVPFGAEIRTDVDMLPYKKELLVALAGPAANIILAVVLLLIYFLANSRVVMFFAACNLILAFINLVPVRTLDGSRALSAVLLEKMPYEKADAYIESISSAAFAFLTFASFVLLVVTGCNFSLVIFCVYTFISVYARREM